ncbi:MAG TPA: hypothetical protein VL354_21395 [Spirochaetia bacterium]|nr:hypothetical protein [Spirochaetia bacterium]
MSIRHMAFVVAFVSLGLSQVVGADSLLVGRPLPVVSISGDSGGRLDGSPWSSTEISGPALVIVAPQKQLRDAAGRMRDSRSNSDRPVVMIIEMTNGRSDLRQRAKQRLESLQSDRLTIVIDRNGLAAQAWQATPGSDRFLAIGVGADGTVESVR